MGFSGRGGKRPGAGRPPKKKKTVLMSFRLARDVADFLKAHDIPARELVERAVRRFMKATETTTQDTTDLSDRIRVACMSLGGPGRRIYLRDIQKALPDVAKVDLDRALLAMQRNEDLVLMHMDDPQERTPEDEAAAVDILGFKRHILYLN